MENNNKPFSYDGLFRQNIVLVSGLVTAPIIIACTTLMHALVLSIGFFMMSYLSIVICRFIPSKIAYTFRIMLYALVAAALYVPTILFLRNLFPEAANQVMLYIGLMTVNSLLFAKTESRFYLIPFGKMAIDVLVYIMGFALVAFVVGFVRELLANGTLFGTEVCPAIMPAASSPFFGFILVGLLAALCRAISKRRKERGDG